MPRQHPYTPLAVANTFIKKKEWGQSVAVEHLKLQKLVYFSHGYSLALWDKSIVSERPQVWRYGPVFETLYDVLRDFGRGRIESPQPYFYPQEQLEMVDENDKKANDILFKVWERYGHEHSFRLSAMTHKPGSPWHKCAEAHNFRVPRHLEIPDSFIKEEFERILQRKSNL